ncbi:4Fe-4S dicluster domain-containing protein, partial [bacterium]|nr:4Fe-4S dicluster domain-containing protein [bacterium]
YVGMSRDCKIKDPRIRQYATHQLVGNYPANNPGVFLYYNKKGPEENNSWGIKAYDVMRIGQLFDTGFYPNKRCITFAGSSVDKPRYVSLVEGTPVKALLEGSLKDSSCRYICGGVLTGQRVQEDDFISYRDSSLHVIPEGSEQELLHFFKPGFDKPTFGNTYLSTLIKDKEWKMTSSLNGGYRACISCGVCPEVCPLDIYPQLLMKHLEVNDIETAMEQGLLDCVDCGLCTYVCPSKIELGETISRGRKMVEKEISS